MPYVSFKKIPVNFSSAGSPRYWSKEKWANLWRQSPVVIKNLTRDPEELSPGPHPSVATHVSTKTEAHTPHVVVADTVVLYESLHGEGYGGSYCLCGRTGLWVVDLFGALLPVCWEHVHVELDRRGDTVHDKQRHLMPEGINARVSSYYICWHSITIVCYTFVQQLEIYN